MNKQNQDFYNKNPNFKRDDRGVKFVGNQLASIVTPTNKPGQVAKKPMTPFKTQGVAEGFQKGDRVSIKHHSPFSNPKNAQGIIHSDLMHGDGTSDKFGTQVPNGPYHKVKTRQGIVHVPLAHLSEQGVAEGRGFSGVGGARDREDDEHHHLDPSDWFVFKDGKMYKVSVYPNQHDSARSHGYSPSREEAKAKAARGSQDVAEGKIDFAKKLQKNVDKSNKAVVKTRQDIGSRIADIGAGGKEYNVKTDAAWDAAKKKVSEGSKQ
jgi:hypothetical protein